MSKEGMVTDFTVFDRTFRVQGENMLKAAERGVGEAMTQLLTDCVMISPTVPHKEGSLRGSGSAFSGRKLVHVTPNVGGNPTPSLDSGEPNTSQTIVGMCGFNTPYAMRLHEHPEFEFKEDGSGGKFMESKINAFKDGYAKMVADEIDGADKVM